MSEYENIVGQVTEEKTKDTNLSEILSLPITTEIFLENKTALYHHARLTLKSLSHETSGSGNLKMALQEELAQEVPQRFVYSFVLEKCVLSLRDQSDMQIFNDRDKISQSELPDGIYRNLNIFTRTEGEPDRTAFFDERQTKLWQEKDIRHQDEGLAFSPVYSESQLLVGVKLFWQGHRHNLHVRTILVNEIKNYLDSGTQVMLDDYIQIRSL